LESCDWVGTLGNAPLGFVHILPTEQCQTFSTAPEDSQTPVTICGMPQIEVTFDVALGVLYDLGLAAFHDSDARICGAEIDPDDFGHAVASL
jgi:NAD-specific glutamate dehydrogenase